MWYNRLSEYLLKEGFKNDPICPCVFIKRLESGFSIVTVYVDDLNLVSLQIEHTSKGILIHQLAYTEKVLKHFHMDKAHPLSSPMVVRTLDVKKDPFCPKEDDEENLGPKQDIVLHQLEDIGMGVKHVLRYLRGTTDMGLFYPYCLNPQLIGYADAGYLSDPHKGRSQTGYLFTYGNTAISWRSVKQTISATSSNHSEIIAIHEASRECVWLRSVIQHIQEKCGLSSIKGSPTILYEDNAACITQIRGGYIKGDRTKHISPKFFYTHELQKSGDIDIKQIRSSDNLADLFTKLPTATFKKIVYNIGMRRFKDLHIHEGE
uniref:Reverse transcriptase Ty1/copia-type domain-containing protein n=1 Tax=Fagus sylvatica TaxID=28930 RepID=A0A2N9I801_FAGSY